MNPNIEKLYEISKKCEKIIIGLMSGTSLDGLDIALCSFKGHGEETDAKLLKFETIDYAEGVKEEIRKVFGKREIDFQQLCVLNPWIGILHGKLVLETLEKWQIKTSDVDIIASHGQTVFHAPKWFHNLEKYENSTLQIGDGDHLAVKTGIITISDFRQKHIASGGEGAPLALYGDYLLFSQRGEDRILLNLGGIANFTYLPGKSTSGLFSTDTGPGNTLLDAYSRELFGKTFDEGGNCAKAGNINHTLLKALKNNPFFERKCPKTTGPELFNEDYVKAALDTANINENISAYDLLATLTRFTVETIAETVTAATKEIENMGKSRTKKVIFISGGGSHNVFLVDQLRCVLSDYQLQPIDTLGISGDAKEAVLFATLANECLCGQQNYDDVSGETRNLMNISMGKISFPT